MTVPISRKGSGSARPKIVQMAVWRANSYPFSALAQAPQLVDRHGRSATEQAAKVANIMVLVELITPEQAPLLAKAYFADGDPGPITAALAQVPELLEVALPFIGAVLSPSSIDWRTKEMVILRTSAILACRYCVDSHTPVALDSGLTHEEVRALREIPAHDERAVSAFADGRERALMSWIDAVALGPGPVAPSAAIAIKKHYANHEIVELTLLIATTLLLNRFATALQLPVHPSTIERLVVEGFADETP